jgi:hypothetical protein
VKEKVMGGARREKAREMAKEKAERLLEKLRAGESMDKVASRERLTIEETGYFTRRSGFIGKIGSSEELVREAFSLTSESPSPQKVYIKGNRYFVVQLKEREGVERKKFLSQKEKIREKFLAQKREERANRWLKGLRERAEIKILMTI